MAAESPVSPYRGKLRLTRSQEQRLMTEFQDRHKAALDAMGFVIEAQYDGWLGIRKEAWSSYYNDFTYRQNTARYAALFRLWNSSVNIPKRAARLFKAKAADAIFGIEPFVGLEPEGDEDVDPAVPLAQRFFNRKLNDADAKDCFRQAIEQACVSGEAVIKIARKPSKVGPSRGRVWMTGGGQAIDEQTGQMVNVPETSIQDTTGKPVTEHDAWEADAMLVGVERLQRDPEVKKPHDARLSEYLIPLDQTPGWGDLDLGVIPYQDFVISPNQESVEKADYCAHVMQWEEGDARAFLTGSHLTPEAQQWLDGVHRATNKTRVESRQPNESTGEKKWTGDIPVGMPKLSVAESWGRFDLNDDGKTIIEVCLLWDVNAQFPIGYDYRDEATSLQNERPFKVVRIIKAKDRWHGIGFYELLSNEHSFIDRQWNRIDARSGTSGTFKWHKKGAIIEVERGIPLELNSPRVYTIDSSVEDPRMAFGFVEMPKMDENIWNMLNQAIQNAQAMSGTMMPSDSANSDLNQSDTLGEQELLNQESDVMNGDIMQDLTKGLTETLRAALYVVFKNIRPEDANMLLSAERAKQLLDWITANVPKLQYHLKLTLKKARNRQQMQANEQALVMLVGEVPYFQIARTDPEVAERVKPLIEGVLASNEIPGVDKIMKPLPIPLPNPTDPNAPASAGQPPPTALPPPA